MVWADPDRQRVLRSNVRLPARLEGVEVVRPARAGFDPRYRPQPGAVDPPGVVIDPGQIGLLRTVDPEREAAIVRARHSRSAPVQLDRVRYVADREPTGALPG